MMPMSFVIIYFLFQISFTLITSTQYPCLPTSQCGCSSKSAVVNKIIGGEEADANTWGWAVSIRYNNNHLCGGSLIDSDLVVTAAHCFHAIDTISKMDITAGSKYLSSMYEQRMILNVFIHRFYNASTYSNDIAVIRLSSPLNMNDHSLARICLPSQTMKNPTNNTNVVAIGWGVVSKFPKTASEVLQQVTLKTVANDHNTCRSSIYNTAIQFCAGVQGGGKDTCQGDSGGPLMMFDNGKWYLLGITSYGKDCALASHAGVYTKVSVYEKELKCLLGNDTICVKKIFQIRNSVSSIFVTCYISYFLIFFVTIYFM